MLIIGLWMFAGLAFIAMATIWETIFYHYDRFLSENKITHKDVEMMIFSNVLYDAIISRERAYKQSNEGER